MSLVLSMATQRGGALPLVFFQKRVNKNRGISMDFIQTESLQAGIKLDMGDKMFEEGKMRFRTS